MSSLNQLKFELNIQVNHIFGLLKAKKLLKGESGEIKLHLGCGKRHLKGWLNIDIRKDADLFLDLREKWPFSDCYVNNIFAEHLLEHFEYPDNALHFLKEAYRVLKPAAELRLGVPDTEWPLKAYVEGIDSDYFRISKEVWHPKHLKTSMEHINWHFRDFKGNTSMLMMKKLSTTYSRMQVSLKSKEFLLIHLQIPKKEELELYMLRHVNRELT